MKRKYILYRFILLLYSLVCLLVCQFLKFIYWIFFIVFTIISFTTFGFFTLISYSLLHRFIERNWPKTCRIEFSLKSYKGPKDTEPQLLHYRGRFKRSLLNPQVFFMRGKIYREEGRL